MLLVILWLVMSGNSTFETSDFADLRFSFEAPRVLRSLPECSYGKEFLRNMKKNDFVFFFQGVCLFPPFE